MESRRSHGEARQKSCEDCSPGRWTRCQGVEGAGENIGRSHVTGLERHLSTEVRTREGSATRNTSPVFWPLGHHWHSGIQLECMHFPSSFLPSFLSFLVWGIKAIVYAPCNTTYKHYPKPIYTNQEPNTVRASALQAPRNTNMHNEAETNENTETKKIAQAGNHSCKGGVG